MAPDEGSHESVQPRLPQTVSLPSQREVDEHEATGCAVYRSWCPHCVGARGRAERHTRVENESDFPELWFDYGFMGELNETEPMIIARDAKLGHFAASTVDKKGFSQYAVAYLVGWLRSLGHKRIVARSDNERSLLKLLEVCSDNVPGIEWIPKTCPEGDSQANGGAEVAVREIKDQIRAVRSLLETKLGEKLPENADILAWLPRYCANVINRYRIGRDGKTPERRRTGRQWARPAGVFGEKMFFRLAGKVRRQATTEMRKIAGIFVGNHERTGSALFLTESGLRRGTGIAKVPIEDRWKKDFLQSCKGLPWDPTSREKPKRSFDDADAQAPVVPSTAVRPPKSARKFYVLRDDIEKYGGTKGCPGCTVRGALAGHGVDYTVQHNDECRTRMRELLERDRETRIGADARLRAYERRVAREAAVQSEEPSREAGSSVPDGREEDAEMQQQEEQPERGSEADRMEAGSPVPPSAPSAPSSSQGVRRPAEEERSEEGPPGSKRRIQREKRSASTDVEALREEAKDTREDAMAGVDDDIKISMPTFAEQSQELADATDSLPSAAALSREKEAMSLELAEKVVDAYAYHGMHTTREEAQDIARCLCSLTAVSVAEIFSPPRLTEMAGELGVKASFCIDLSTNKPDGNPWDLSDPGDVELLKDLQMKQRPYLLAGGPPCTDFCRLLYISQTREQIAARQESSGIPLMRAAVDAYWRQLDMGNHFLHEQPEGNESWQLDFIQELENDPRVYRVRGPMCHWKMKIRGSDGKYLPGYARKMTGWLTSSKELADELSQVCSNTKGGVIHRHVKLEGGNRTKQAARYPPKLVRHILKAITREYTNEGLAHAANAFAAGPVCEEADGKAFSAEDLNDESQHRFWDDVNGGWLDPIRVRAARRLEVDWIVKRNVLKIVKRTETKGKKLLDLRWVDTQKSDGTHRSRLVVREIKKAKKASERLSPEEVFSSMPPIESLRMVVSELVTIDNESDVPDLCIGVWDVSRAHFYGEACREIFVQLPAELGSSDEAGLLLKSMYGTEDASHIWGETWPAHLKEAGIEVGKANRALFAGAGIRGFCHGDDFVALGSLEDLGKFEKHLAKKFDIRQTGLIGFAPELGKELKVLNRTVRLDADNVVAVIEADRKHVKMLVEELGISGGRSPKTPSVKLTDAQNIAADESELLNAAESTRYRSCLMRCKYLDQDRVDITETVKSLAQKMSAPRAGHMERLLQLARYLRANPRHETRYPRQCRDGRSNLFGYSDSDWAGDRTSRRSTTGLVIMRGVHLIRHQSTLQGSIALSSAEAEFYALGSTAAYGLGIQSYFRDWNVELKITCYSDSSSGLSFASRRGLGRIRHVETRFLWLQERVALKHLKVLKVNTKDNPADALTKPLSKGELDRYLRRLGEMRKEDNV